MSDKDPKVSTATEWRTKVRIRSLKLPSGVTVKLRDPSLPSMMRRGIIPTRLFAAAMEIEKAKNKSKKKDGALDKPDNVDTKDFKMYCEFLAVIVCEAVVEPKVTLNEELRGKPGTIHYDEIPGEDLDVLMKVIEVKQGGNSGLLPATFPEKTAAGPS